MKKITEEMNLHQGWYESAKEQTIETLPVFINHLLNDYDYGTICHAIAAGGIAAMYAMNGRVGISGFQAQCIMWQVIRVWKFSNNKTGLRLIDYDNMLYPQYKDEFKKVISRKAWDKLREQAALEMKGANRFTSEEVLTHWQNIINGVVPFGYEVKDELI